MTYPLHYRLTFGGHRGFVDAEGWECCIRMAALEPEVTDRVLEPYAILASVIMEPLRDWFTRPESHISPNATLEWVKFNFHGPDGREEEDISNRARFPEVLHGGAEDGQEHPWQMAVALTWRSSQRTRGTGSHGRIYCPAPCVDVSPASGLFPGGIAEQMATSAKDMLKGIDVAQPFRNRLFPSIVSGVGAGAASRIDLVSVDNRLDTLRSRAKQLEPIKYAQAINWF